MARIRDRKAEPYGKAIATLLGDAHDKRVKIPKSEHEYIRQRHKAGEGIRHLGRVYGVDKRTIQFILFPERLAIVRKHSKARGQSRKSYLNEKGKKWADRMKELRHRKKSLFYKKDNQLK